MARVVLRLVRATGAQNAAYIGPVGEPVLNTDTGTVHVHDGQTPGGLALLSQASLVSAIQAVAAALPREPGGATPHLWINGQGSNKGPLEFS